MCGGVSNFLSSPHQSGDVVRCQRGWTWPDEHDTYDHIMSNVGHVEGHGPLWTRGWGTRNSLTSLSVIFLVTISNWSQLIEVPVWQNLDWGTWSAYEECGPRGGGHGPPRFRSTDGMIVGWENNNLPGDVIWIQLLNKSEYHRCDLINLFKLIVINLQID